MEELVRQGLYPTKSSIVQDAVAIFLDKRGDQQIIQKQLVALLANDPEVRAAVNETPRPKGRGFLSFLRLILAFHIFHQHIQRYLPGRGYEF